MTLSPFEHQQDEVLGRLLREQLTGPRPEAFLDRMRLAVAGAGRPSQWDVLAGWARPRAMALALAAALLLWLGAWFESTRTTADAGVTMASLPTHSVVSSQPPAVDEIMAALRERP
ncbi:MAG TPA: hypothetical protein VGQ69_11600 [Gemmatimonadales bacterium]|jgi:hypothetical protein|nr:hypothetical protein [Gemmatimonadales bacterium]